jgi:hypothetical protein
VHSSTSPRTRSRRSNIVSNGPKVTLASAWRYRRSSSLALLRCPRHYLRRVPWRRGRRVRGGHERAQTETWCLSLDFIDWVSAAAADARVFQVVWCYRTPSRPYPTWWIRSNSNAYHPLQHICCCLHYNNICILRFVSPNFQPSAALSPCAAS